MKLFSRIYITIFAWCKIYLIIFNHMIFIFLLVIMSLKERWSSLDKILRIIKQIIKSKSNSFLFLTRSRSPIIFSRLPSCSTNFLIFLCIDLLIPKLISSTIDSRCDSSIITQFNFIEIFKLFKQKPIHDSLI